MKIFVIGTRGIPDIPGGIETHCQELYPRIVAAGHEVTIVTRTPYVQKKRKSWKGVSLKHLFAPRIKVMEALIHTLLGVINARISQPDLIHVHAIGPSLLVPLIRLMGMKVVMTNHGPDYHRDKWGFFAKQILLLGEYWGGKHADEIIVISSVIGDIVKKRCNRESNLIYNSVTLPERTAKTNILDQQGILPGKYILAVARLVPEKGLHDLVEAFAKISGDQQLVIAGDADHETKYSRELKKRAVTDSRVVLTGYITGEYLSQVFSHAKLFVLPSYHEGLPIALLEAMSYDIPPLISDIPAHKEIKLFEYCYFRCGDLAHLQNQLERALSRDISRQESVDYRSIVAKKYNWDKIAQQTIVVYEKALK
ncbi:glycosyltransferase family 4 protein [bacterium]|nr:glycosyltransferase family 4 protein [bacterium]